MQAECTNCTTAAHVQVADIAKLGLAVTATFAIMWAPFLGRTSDFLQVLHRIVPVRRGLYEDYVANFWCTTSLAIKWRSLFSQQVSSACQDIYSDMWWPFLQAADLITPHSDALLRVLPQDLVMMMPSYVQALIRLCTVSTVLFAAPVLVKEVLRPTPRGLLVCMGQLCICILPVFSYQVRCRHASLASS